MPLGQVTNEIVGLNTNLQEAAVSAAALEPAAPLVRREWFVPTNAWSIPSGFDGTLPWQGNPLVGSSIRHAFSRDAIGAIYTEIVANGGGSLGEAACMKVQSDWIAACERAYRSRHLTAVRSSIHAMGRNSGKGHNRGPYSKVIKVAESFVSMQDPVQ